MIGGSLLAAGRARALFGRATGADPDPAARRAALEAGLVEAAFPSAADAAAGADLFVAAPPVEAIAGTVLEALPVLAPGAVVTDVGSVKAPVVEAVAAAARAAGVPFVPGHPIAGTERAGISAADPEMFVGRRVVLTPAAGVPAAAVDRVGALWESLGATVLRMDPAAHDAAFAALSHLPHLAAFAILATLADDPTLAEAAPRLAGGGLRDTTRIGASSPRLWRGICLANRRPLLAALDRFERQLARLRRALEAGDGAALEEAFARAKALRDRF
jgi:prephenate dehydrogenase